ncbi:NAD(P)-dependent oxidoreductase [Streptomyces sp. NPDC058953]|uniref:NAD(P)-dependent oxidoreductase n=1 Tax=unclassified Streptomyces TaxID=2593676 RepID=UPI0036BBA8C0
MNDTTNVQAQGIVVFGAGGRVGRAVVTEAVTRGHRVTAVVRDPDRAFGLGSDAVTVVRGDVGDPESVAAVAAGHRAAINATARLDIPSEEFFVGAAKALVAGLTRAGVGRLVTLGIVSTLETAPGVRLMDDPGFPEPHRIFARGHAAEFDLLRREAGGLDWLMVCPPDLSAGIPRTGRYRTADGTVIPDGRICHDDLAKVLLDEAVTPRHHRVQLAVASTGAVPRG